MSINHAIPGWLRGSGRGDYKRHGWDGLEVVLKQPRAVELVNEWIREKSHLESERSSENGGLTAGRWSLILAGPFRLAKPGTCWLVSLLLPAGSISWQAGVFFSLTGGRFYPHERETR